MWSLRHRSQLRHWSWVKCWNWRWFAPLPRQPRLLPLAPLPDNITSSSSSYQASPVAASSASIFSTQACFPGNMSVYSTPRSARPEASAASRSNCSSRDTWLTGLLPTRTHRESSSNSLKKFRALAGMLVGDTGDVEATAHSCFTVETKARMHCDNSDVGIHLIALEMLLIRFSSRCAVTTWSSHRSGGVMEESKKQVPARHTHQASSNRTSAMSTRNCIRDNGTLESIKSQHDENHSWLLVVGCVVVLLLYYHIPSRMFRCQHT